MPRNNTSPRRQRTSSDNEGGIDLSVAAERTIGNFGGIRADASVEVGIDGILRNNRLSGSYDPIERTASFDAGLGSRQAKLGGEIGGEITLKENGSIESIGGKAGISFGGFGGGISASSSGSGAISAEAFGGKIEVARDDKGNVSMSICYGIGIASMCTNFSRDTGDPQNTGSLRPTISARPGSNRPNRPASPNIEPPPRRKKPEPKKPTSESTPEKPNPNPRPKPEPKPKPTTPKKPTLDPKPKKKPPADIRKKPPIDLKKKSPIDLKKKSPIDLKPIIDLRKPTPPKPPKLPKPARPVPTPTPTPTPPKRPTPAPKPTPTPKPKRPSPWPRPLPPGDDGSFKPDDTIPFNIACRYSVSILCLGSGTEYIDCIGYGSSESSQGWMFKNQQPVPGIYGAFGKRTKHPWRDYYIYEIDTIPSPVGFVEIRQLGGSRPVVKGNLIKGAGPWYKDDAPVIGSNVTVPGNAYYSDYWTSSHGMDASYTDYYLKNFRNGWPMAGYPEYRIKIDQKCPGDPDYKPLNKKDSPKFIPPRLPNNPPKIKPMNCCDKIEDIYKYFGIAKLKKNKFKVAKAFMVPGGEGNEECEDYYAINQALFRMLANGLIINPTSKPLGSDWKSVNATAWAGNVYEMVAEAMSNGNSSQKYEISMMMQITQLLSIVSELTRKVEFLSEVLGTEPDLDIEEIMACFTVYEGHKGFEKKEPKKIDIAKSKTDDEVEATLGKMLRPS